jgi:NADH dehydrogenase
MPCRILVLGGGFAGLAAVDRLARRRGSDKLDVRLIDRRDESVFSPLLPDLISARVRSRNILHPIAPHCRRRGAEFVQARVLRVEPDPPRALTDRGTHEADFIIVCLGCETNYFGDEAMAAAAPGLKSVSEGRAIRRRALERFDAASAAGERARFFVVGGGYTGFEAASHLAFALARHGRLALPQLPDRASVAILEKSDQPLRNCSPRVRRWACELMRRWGIEVRTGTTVSQATSDGRVCLSDGTAVDRAMAVWAAGVAPGEAVAGLDAPRVAAGRLAVDPYLRAGPSGRVFAAGDVAGPAADGGVLRMSVQFSLLGGAAAADNAVRAMRGEPLRRFAPLDPGYLVPLAPWRAAGVVLGRELTGRLPAALHYSLCLFRSWSWQDRAGVLLDLCRKGPIDERFDD